MYGKRYQSRQPLAIVALCLLATYLPGCFGGLNVRAENEGDGEIAESHCEPATGPVQEDAGSREASVYWVNGGPRPVEGDQSDLHRFSSRAQEVAAIIGVRHLLTDLHLLEEDIRRGMEDAPLRMLAVRQELSDRLLLALFESSSIAAELECEKARTEDLASRLEEIRNDIQQTRTVMAILADSISGVFAGTFLLLGSEVLSGIIDLSGSVGALGFGVAALGGDQTYELKHGRNLMADVWQGGASSRQFPQPVWQYLNGQMRETSKRSRRDTILGSWRARLGKPGSKQERRQVDLFFGAGGIYRIHELRHRSEMLGLLKTHVNLMTQDLNLLFRETLHDRSVVTNTQT